MLLGFQVLKFIQLLRNEFFRDQDNSVQKRLNEFTKIKLSFGEKALLSSAAQLYEVQGSVQWNSRAVDGGDPLQINDMIPSIHDY